MVLSRAVQRSFAVTMLVTTFAACGGTEEPAQETPADAAMATYRDYDKAFAAGDGEAACALLGEEMREVYAGLAKQIGAGKDCGAAVKSFAERVEEAGRPPQPPLLKVSSATDDEVVLVATYKDASLGSDTIIMRAQGDGWIVFDLTHKDAETTTTAG